MNRERTIYSVDERGVARLLLDRPEKLNAIDAKMRVEIQSTLAEVNSDPEIKALVITGSGRYFSAGIDMKEYANGSARPRTAVWPAPAAAIDLQLAQVKKLTIAALNGPAVGMSCGLALACDFRIMAESATLWENHSRITTPSGASWYLPRLIGVQRTMEMLILCEPIDAVKAVEWGLAYRAVPDGQLDDATETLVKRILEYSPSVLQFTKASIMGGLSKDLPNAMDYVSWTRYAAGNLGVTKEATRAIADKKDPDYPA